VSYLHDLAGAKFTMDEAWLRLCAHEGASPTLDWIRLSADNPHAHEYAEASRRYFAILGALRAAGLEEPATP
jgi:hypothetical protein